MTKIIITILVIGGIGAGIYFGTKEKSIPQEQIVETTTPAPTTENKKMAFSRFAESTDPYVCTVRGVDTFESSGTVYLHNGMIRGSFTSIAEGRTVDSEVLIRDGFTYMWSSLIPNNMGIRVQASATESPRTSAVYEWRTDQVGDYDCAPWTPTLATFTVPTTISFTSL